MGNCIHILVVANHSVCEPSWNCAFFFRTVKYMFMYMYMHVHCVSVLSLVSVVGHFA